MLESLDTVTGSITIEPFDETPAGISWELNIGSGRTDLSVCGHFEDFPCGDDPPDQ